MNYIEHDGEIQAAVQAVIAAGVDCAKLFQLADFYFDGDEHPRTLVNSIIKAGCKLEFGGHQLFEVSNGTTTFFFVGRKPRLIEEIRNLLS